jgi:type I restriction enzyme, S subunit
LLKQSSISVHKNRDGVVAIAGRDIVINQQLHAFLPNETINPYYLSYALIIRKNYMESVATKTAIPYMNKENCNSIPIPFPSKAEQEAIATVLSDTDTLIERLEELIAKKRDIKQATMQQLLTGKKRLPKFSRELKPAYKQTEIGMIPEDWELKTVEEIADVRGGKRLPAGKVLSDSPTPYPYIRISDMFYGGVSLDEIKYVPIDVFPSIKNSRIHKDDIFVTVAGTLGIVGKVPPELNGANLTENADKITHINCDVNYLLYTLMSPRIQRAIESQETVSAQPKLALNRIEKFRIALPTNKAEQQAIAAILSDIDAEIAALEQKRNKTQALKQGMMQELLTGKTRLI